MSDMLQKLLGVEKTAAKIVADAEADANRLVAQARLEVQSRHMEFMKKKAAENEAAVTKEKEKLAAERETRNGAEREKLSRLAKDPASFRAVALSFLQKGRE